MSFLRRLFGGDGEEAGDPGVDAAPPPTAAELEEAEREHVREVLQGEAARIDDLRERQLRYAQYAWTPPPQGGEKRADDEETVSGESG